jgi:septation ring formation regulator EzrA
MSLGLGLFLIGLALFIGAFGGMVVMGMFCEHNRKEIEHWRNKYFELEPKVDEWSGKYEKLSKEFEKSIKEYSKLQKNYNDLINKEV